MMVGAATSPAGHNSPIRTRTKLVTDKNSATGAFSTSPLPHHSNQDHHHVYHHSFAQQQEEIPPGVKTGVPPHSLYNHTTSPHHVHPGVSTFPHPHTTRLIHHFVPQCPTWLGQSDAAGTLRGSRRIYSSAQRDYIQLPEQVPPGGTTIPWNDRITATTTTHIHVYPSKLAVLVANQVEVKQEKNASPQQHTTLNTSCLHTSAEELSYTPDMTSTTTSNNASVSEEGNNNFEYKKRSSIYRQRDDSTKNLTLDQIINIASIDEIIGFDDDDDGNHEHKSSMYFSYSFLLSSSAVKRTFRYMIDSQCSKSSRSNIVNLLLLEKKSVKWYGNKIPYAFFGICLTEKITKWIEEVDDTFKEKVLEEDWTKDHVDVGLTRGKVQALNEKLVIEINILKRSLYSLSEQKKSDLGLMCPKLFIKSRNNSIAKGLLRDHKKGNALIILDDDSL